jgi:hypothetical protein
MVRKGLQVGESGHKLATARALHPLQIAVFNSPTGCDDEPVEDWDEPPYGLSDLNKNKADGSSVVD